MTNNTTNKTENKELTSYQKLLRNLDDDAFAYEFKVKTLDRAKNLIGDILAVTTGSNIVTEQNGEWGHGTLLELFEILTIRHKNFYVPDFLENLSDYLFTWTMTSDEANSNWRKNTLAERGLDEYGIKFDAPFETEDELKVLDLSNSSVEDLAQTLSGIMHNPHLPKPIKDCLKDNLNSNHIDFYSPENILGNLKELSEEES
jgi:hypothetical protein